MMQCQFEINAGLGVYVCSFCGFQSKEDINRECTVSEVQRLKAQAAGRKRKGCGCGGRKQAAPTKQQEN
jgi:hypothetical protein